MTDNKVMDVNTKVSAIEMMYTDVLVESLAPKVEYLRGNAFTVIFSESPDAQYAKATLGIPRSTIGFSFNPTRIKVYHDECEVSFGYIEEYGNRICCSDWLYLCDFQHFLRSGETPDGMPLRDFLIFLWIHRNVLTLDKSLKAWRSDN